MRKPEKKVYGIWIIQAFIPVIILSALFSWPIQQFSSLNVFTGFASIFVVLSALAVLYTVYRYRAWSFEMKEDHLYLEHGVFRKVYSMVPYVRIQHVDTQRDVLDRFFGLSRVVVYTAGSRGADVTVPGLLPADADDIQRKLRDVAIESEDRDAV
ncbi:PH domain-containing protein [Candidatus Nanohalovita haloferacivicina]|uniref:PH domain-containing protein n=1 Tax=Candidatus Nanohalovita haloferacivicina TaxID=2978046 RepID=UPI00325FC6A4|nr:Putative membrane protein, contains bPH2 domain [Candidatus Nanohalobia archaeon BNXNv]